MNKIIVKILILISIIIIIFGISAGKSIKDEVKDSGIHTQNIYIDGSDATALTEALLEMGSGLLGIVIIIYSFLGVACIWGIYGIILLIMMIIKKCKSIKNVEQDVKVKRGED